MLTDTSAPRQINISIESGICYSRREADRFIGRRAMSSASRKLQRALARQVAGDVVASSIRLVEPREADDLVLVR